MLCGQSGSGRCKRHAAPDEGVANVKHFTGIRENGAYPRGRLGFGRPAEFGKVGLIVQLGEILVKTAETQSNFGDSIAHLVTLGAQGYDAAATRKLAMRAERLTADGIQLSEDEGPRRAIVAAGAVGVGIWQCPTVAPS